MVTIWQARALTNWWLCPRSSCVSFAASASCVRITLVAENPLVWKVRFLSWVHASHVPSSIHLRYVVPQETSRKSSKFERNSRDFRKSRIFFFGEDSCVQGLPRRLAGAACFIFSFYLSFCFIFRFLFRFFNFLCGWILFLSPLCSSFFVRFLFCFNFRF